MLLALLAGIQNAAAIAPPPPVTLTPIPVTGVSVGGAVEGWTDGAGIAFGVVRRTTVYGVALLDSIDIPGGDAFEPCSDRPGGTVVPSDARPTGTFAACAPRPA